MRPSLIWICIVLFLPLSHAQEPVKKDSITELDEVILLEARKSTAENGIVPTQIIGGKVFRNYSPIDLVSPINQISGVYILSGALNTKESLLGEWVPGPCTGRTNCDFITIIFPLRTAPDSRPSSLLIWKT